MSLQPPKLHIKHQYSANGTQIIVRVVGHVFYLVPTNTVIHPGHIRHLSIAEYTVTELGHNFFTGTFDECLAFCEAL